MDSETCLSALLQLYYKASTRSGNTGAAATAALNGLLERILGPVTTVEAQGQEVGFWLFVWDCRPSNLVDVCPLIACFS